MHKLALALCLASVSVMAQWPDRPTPGVPRTKDGKPKLTAPAPRASNGKPDLSGVWAVNNFRSLFYVGYDLKPGDMLPWAASLFQKREAEFRRDADSINCLPPGPKAGFATGSFPMKIVQTPGLTVILYEYQTIFRQVFTDGRDLPKDPNPNWMGYSVGRWDGDNFVVTTIGYNDRSALDLAGHPHSEALRLTERYHRRDAGHLDLQVTFDDPKTYARQWTLPVEFSLVPDGELLEYFCENERDKGHLVGSSGQEVVLPPALLSKYPGVYANPTAQVTIALEGGRLMINEGNQGKIPLVAHSQTTFTMEGTGVEFTLDAKGQATALTQHWTEGDRVFNRVQAGR